MHKDIRVEIVVKVLKDGTISTEWDEIVDFYGIYQNYFSELLEDSAVFYTTATLQRDGEPDTIDEKPFPEAELNVIGYYNDPPQTIAGVETIEQLAGLWQVLSDNGFDTVYVLGGGFVYDTMLSYTDAIHRFYAPVDPDPYEDHEVYDKKFKWDRSEWMLANDKMAELRENDPMPNSTDDRLDYYERLDPTV